MARGDTNGKFSKSQNF